MRTGQLWIACVMLVASFGAPLHAQERSVPREHFARERSYDVLHYRLNLEIDEKAKTCTGTATITLLPLRPALDVVELDAAEMNVASVSVGAVPAQFTHSSDTLSVMLGRGYGLKDTLTLQATYAVRAPRKDRLDQV